MTMKNRGEKPGEYRIEDPTFLAIEDHQCPECGIKVDTVSGGVASTGINGPIRSALYEKRPAPKPGDPILCANCGLVTTLENNRLRPLSRQERRRLERSPKFKAMIAMLSTAIHFARAARRAANN